MCLDPLLERWQSFVFKTFSFDPEKGCLLLSLLTINRSAQQQSRTDQILLKRKEIKNILVLLRNCVQSVVDSIMPTFTAKVTRPMSVKYQSINQCLVGRFGNEMALGFVGDAIHLQLLATAWVFSLA